MPASPAADTAVDSGDLAPHRRDLWRPGVRPRPAAALLRGFLT
ncbi:MAG TPA: hypothetical protein VE198_09770 [Actinoallomurus sp.]|nr:hypothetical protein [Actinoallomurus sp.]